jgi:uncharacterized protein
MSDFFAKRDPWGNGPALWIFAGLLFLAPLMPVALRQLKTDNNVQNWLPEDDPQARVLTWFHSHFPAEDRIVVTWDGSSLTDPRVERMRQALAGQVDPDGVRRGGSPYIAEVLAARDVCEKIVSYGVEPDEVLRRLQGSLIGTGLIKVRLTSAGRLKESQTITAIRQAAAAQLGLEIEITKGVAEYIDAQAIAAWEAEQEALEEDETESASALACEIPRHDFRVGWHGKRAGSDEVARFCKVISNVRGFATVAEPDGLRLVDECFESVGSPVGMVITLSEAGSADNPAVVAEIRTAAAAAGIPLDDLHMGGSAVTTAELNKAMKRCSWNLQSDSWLPHKQSVLVTSFAVAVVLAFYFLRSLRLGILVLGISSYATMLTVTLVPLTGGTMNMVLMVMPTLLNVLTLSGAIHVANYWRHAAYEDPATAIIRATQMARQPCVLASLTTAVGLISLLTSDLGPVRDFGLYSAIGCLIALFMVLFGLPTLLQLWPTTRPSARDIESQNWNRFGSFVTRHASVLSGVCLLAFVVSTAGLMHFKTETKVIRYFPEHARLVTDTRAIEQSLGGVATIELVVRFSPQAQKELAFLQRMEIIREVQDRIGEHPEVSGTLSLADFQPVTPAPAADARTFQKITYNRRSSEVERRIKEEGETGAAAFLAVAATAEDFNAPGDAGLNAAGDELWRITAQSAVASDSNYGRLTDDINDCVQSVVRMYPGASHVVTGTIPLFLRTQQAVLDSLIWSFALAFGLIALVMMILLRNPLAGLIAMLPNLLPVGVVFGVISWCGQHVDVGSMVTASVALGIAVDGTLHLLSWFRKGVAAGLSRQEAVIQALGHCGPAMWQTSAAVGIGLLMLAPADLLLVSRFGWLMASLVGAALLADVVFLPALLMGPLGLLIERSTPRAEQTPAGIDVPGSASERSESGPPRPHFELADKPVRQRPRVQ